MDSCNSEKVFNATGLGRCLQFGKVDEQLFALDYNPTFMSGLQVPPPGLFTLKMHVSLPKE